MGLLAAALASPLFFVLLGHAAADEQLHVVVQGGDDHPYQTFSPSPGVAWQGWFGLSGVINEAPALASHNGQLYLFVRGIDNALYQRIWNGNQWSDWTRFAGILISGPAAVSHNGQLHVFAVGEDHALYQMYLDGNQWHGWYRIPAVVNGSPAAVSYNGQLNVFVTGGDRALYRMIINGNQRDGWYHLGGTLTTGPAVANNIYNGASLLHVFAGGVDNALYQKFLDGNQWNGWYRIPAVVTGQPAATAYADRTQLHFFVRGGDGALYQMYFDNIENQWHGWIRFPSFLKSGPGATSYLVGGTTPPPPPPGNRPPTLGGVVASRTQLSYGQDEFTRQYGIAARPGIAAIEPLVAPRIITLTGNTPLMMAVLGLPSCCSLLVAEGAADPDGDTVHFHWEVGSGEFKGTYYSTGLDNSGGIPFGARISDLGTYNRNSIFMEMPQLPFPLQWHNLSGATLFQGVHVHDVPPPFTSIEPSANHTSPSRNVYYSYGGPSTINLEIGTSTQVEGTFPPQANWPNGGFFATFPVSISGGPGTNFLTGSPVMYRVDCGGQIRKFIFDSSILPFPAGPWPTGFRISCPYDRDEHWVLPEVVVSTAPSTSATSYFRFPVTAIPFEIDKFDSLACTVGERRWIEVTPPPPARPCSTQQQAGGDTPDTRTIELGRTSGTFRFDYDMQTIKDRIIVRYEGQPLLDTGCVSGAGTANRSYSGISTQVTVEVQPNCEGGTGTIWSYTVYCPQ